MIDGRRTLSPETETDGLATVRVRSGSLVTADPVQTGYQSRKAQARRNCRTGASRLHGSRVRDADHLPHRMDTSWSPHDGEAAAGGVFPAGVNDRGQARHEPNDPLTRAESSRCPTARTASEKGAVCLPQPSSSGKVGR